MYVAGGNKNGIPCNDLYCLDLDSLSKGWQKLQDFPRSPRIQAVSAAQVGPHGEQIFCLWGGFSTSDGNRQATLSTVMLILQVQKNGFHYPILQTTKERQFL